MKKENQKQLKASFGSLFAKPLRWYDWLILAVLCVFCFVTYVMGDLHHTAGCSYGYLDGHFLDFYDYLAKSCIGTDGTLGLHASYLPTVYILFAIWNIPMKLFGIVPMASGQLSIIPLMWAKILPCLVFIASGYIVFLIGREVGFQVRKSKLVMYAYLTAPIAVFTQFILGQYEIFPLFFVLQGVLCWLRKKDFKFVLFFAIAFTFKYTVAIFFVPLLLLREKNLWKAMLKLVCLVSLAVFEILIYSQSPIFKAYAFGVGNAGDNPTGYITYAQYFTGFRFTKNLQTVVYLSVIAVCLVCAYSYFIKPKDKNEEARYGMYLLTLSFAALFCFSKWHPQWLLLGIPFWTITTFMHKNTKVWHLVDIGFGVLLMMFVVVEFHDVCDEVMLSNGVFKYLLPGRRPGTELQMADLIGGFDRNIELSLMTVLIGVMGIFKHPKYMKADYAEVGEPNLGWLRGRLLIPLAAFIIPSMIVLFVSVNPGIRSYQEEQRDIFVLMTDDSVYTQSFESKTGYISKIKFPVSCGKNIDEEKELLVQLLDGNQVLYETTFDIQSVYEGQLLTIAPNIQVEAGKTYQMAFSLPGGKETTFALLGCDHEGFDNAKKNGRLLNYHLDMTVYNK